MRQRRPAGGPGASRRHPGKSLVRRGVGHDSAGFPTLPCEASRPAARATRRLLTQRPRHSAELVSKHSNRGGPVTPQGLGQSPRPRSAISGQRSALPPSAVRLRGAVGHLERAVTSPPTIGGKQIYSGRQGRAYPLRTLCLRPTADAGTRCQLSVFSSALPPASPPDPKRLKPRVADGRRATQRGHGGSIGARRRRGGRGAAPGTAFSSEGRPAAKPAGRPFGARPTDFRQCTGARHGLHRALPRSAGASFHPTSLPHRTLFVSGWSPPRRQGCLPALRDERQAGRCDREEGVEGAAGRPRRPAARGAQGRRAGGSQGYLLVSSRYPPRRAAASSNVMNPW